jgi:hypothetical protein
MAHLHAYGGDNGTRELDALDTVDLEAIALARCWGVQNGHKERRWTYSPCPRPDCGGAIVDGWADACILCARPGGVDPVPVARVNGYSPRRNASGAL